MDIDKPVAEHDREVRELRGIEVACVMLTLRYYHRTRGLGRWIWRQIAVVLGALLLRRRRGGCLRRLCMTGWQSWWAPHQYAVTVISEVQFCGHRGQGGQIQSAKLGGFLEIICPEAVHGSHKSSRSSLGVNPPYQGVIQRVGEMRPLVVRASSAVALLDLNAEIVHGDQRISRSAHVQE